MSKELFSDVTSMEYDKLICGLTPPVHVNSGTVTKLTTAATYLRGTVLCRSSGTGGNGKLKILGTTAATSETLTPDCILCDDAEIGTSEDAVVAVYTAGCFNVDELKVSGSYTMTQDDKDKLRERGLFLGTIAD